ncbi:MAG: hypothetical protein HBSAPP02_05930 [Phycisphaerae bacterium]|nr:MAG: hypothetical protein HBSAPP02_05930 [Phycisphaerae bacterium]
MYDYRSSSPLRARLLASLLMTVGSGGGLAVRAEERGCWPQWRGPNRDATLAGASTWPDDLKGLSLQWRESLGPGYGGPIVWGDQVFTVETRAEKDEVVRALDRSSGQERWRASWAGAMRVPFFARRNGDWIRATPACDGESLYVAGMRDVLVCLNTQDGAERWRVDFPAKLGTPLPSFGFVSSPLIVGDHLYVQAGGALVKLNKKSGEIVWRTLEDGGGMSSAFSSPVVATIQGRRQLVVQTREMLAGIDPDNGAVLWKQKVPSYRGMNILTPTVVGDGLFTSTYKNKTFFYSVRRAEAGFEVAQSWTLPGQGYMSSPVVIDGHAYLHLGNGRLSCIDLKTGEQTWRSRPFGQYWSMVARGDRILALDERGELLLIAADPRQFRLLDRHEVSESEAWAHLAVCDNQVFVRDLNGISVYMWK